VTRSETEKKKPTVLVVEDNVLVRAPIAAYLRDCGYRVLETATSDEAMLVLDRYPVPIDVVFSDAEVAGTLDGFAFTQWVRKNRPQTKIIMAGSPKRAAAAAGTLCEEGPHLAKPYDPGFVEDYIRRLLSLQGSDEPI
jgi:CheY-like chemotaxis protein